jgi:hypothetical protein
MNQINKQCKNSRKILPASLSQYCKQIRASTVLHERLALWSLMIHPLVLNADSDATEDAGAANTSRAIRYRIGYFITCIFH